MEHDFDRLIERRTTNSIKWNRYGKDVLPLWVADMDFRAPPPVVEALARAVDHGIFGYEEPSATLREAVASRLERRQGWSVDPDWVVAVTGIVSAFYAAGRLLCGPGGRGPGYVIQPPVYMPFNDLERDLGLVRQDAPLERTAAGGDVGYRINWDFFSEAFGSRGARTGMFLLCDPHNPAGIAWEEPELRRMAGIALDAGSVLVSDEIHAELLLGPTRHVSVASLDPEIARRSLTLVAPSKTFNTAGLFCGFAVIPDPELRKAYRAMIERLTLHPASLALVAAEAAYSGACDGWLGELLRYLEGNRDFLRAYIRERIPRLAVSRPAATYLAWIDARGLGLDNPQRFFLDKARVALNDGEAFGAGGEGFVRLNFACPRSTLAEALERMRKAVEAL